MRDIHLGAAPIQAAFNAVQGCLLSTYYLSEWALTTVENLSCPQLESESDEEYQESLLGPAKSAQRLIPQLESEIEIASPLVNAVSHELAAALETPAKVGRWSRESFHEGVLGYAQGAVNEVRDGLKAKSSKLPFADRWQLFCKRLSADGRQIFEGERDVLVVMLKKEAIRASDIWLRAREADGPGELSSSSPGNNSVEPYRDRLKLGEKNIVLLDGQAFKVTGKAYKMFQLLLESRGEFVSLIENRFRTRDIEGLPVPLRDTIEATSGAGTRIMREYLA